MAIRKFRYDTRESLPRTAKAMQREDRDAIRLFTTMTFARTVSRVGGFRVVAERAEGPDALVCLGTTRAEALESARRLAGELPADTRRLCLEEWQGGICVGQWRRQRCDRGELPTAPAPRRLRRCRQRLGA